MKLFLLTRLNAKLVIKKTFEKNCLQGDSGSFLICQAGDTYVQVGVVSWGIGCASAGYPGVYANVMELAEWITTS